MIIHSEDFSIISMLNESPDNNAKERMTFFFVTIWIARVSGRVECLMGGFGYNLLERLWIFWMSELRNEMALE